MNVEVIVPTGPESCAVSYSHFFADPDAAEIPDVIALADIVMDQDRRMVEIVQRNLAAGIYRDGLLSPRHENGVQQFQDLVRACDKKRASG
jgi:choline monooxygenase